ncbi:hypothetical protein ACOI1C_07285 [Bacillus sp. DJP31]|uniref:hypothetical protein n=1 Tax=Bacillus sp. DJP31 TaxID=3409789 RepID=UPI003BB5A35C
MNKNNTYIPKEQVLEDIYSQIFIDTLNIDLLKEQLELKSKQYGDFKFSNDIWYCNKQHKDTRTQSAFTIKFDYLDGKYKEILKYFALIVGGSISNINPLTQGQKVSSWQNDEELIKRLYGLL